jgi:halocyanin-like protein
VEGNGEEVKGRGEERRADASRSRTGTAGCRRIEPTKGCDSYGADMERQRQRNRSRRTVLAAVAGVSASALAGCLGGGSGSDTEGGGSENGTGGDGGGGAGGGGGGEAQSYGGFLDGVPDADPVDETGSESVTVEVGVEQRGAPYGFGPAAVRVDRGTTVTWRWVDGENSHNVKAVSDPFDFQSDYATEVGYTFEHTVEETGVARYVCVPHRTMGMKGVVEVV